MTPQLLQKLNERFREFGTTPTGELKYRWANARDMFYLYESGQSEAFKPLSVDADGIERGLWVIGTAWERHCQADRYGPVWMLTAWMPAMSEREWLRTVGTAFPWPRHGEHHPIDSTVLPEGTEPDETLTMYVARKLYLHLGMKVPEYLDTARAGPERRKREQQAEWNDAVDDVIPAFGNIPGEKTHVSFPAVHGI